MYLGAQSLTKHKPCGGGEKDENGVKKIKFNQIFKILLQCVHS